MRAGTANIGQKVDPASAGTLPHAGTAQPRATLIKSVDAEEQLVYGEVYAPGVPDSHGDFMTAETIKKMAHDFIRRGLVDKIDVGHSREESGSYVVESFIARADDPVFIPGSWVLGVKIEDPQIWALVKSGELNGFSLDGIALRTETEITLEIPEVIEGRTDEVEGHSHRFFVKYDAEGVFIGGFTDEGPDGHVHQIRQGTLTEVAKGHAHRFSFVEGLFDASFAA